MPMTASKPSQALILSLGFFMATLMYGVIAAVLAQSNGWSWTWRVLPEYRVLLYAFAGIACILTGAILMLPALPRIPRLAMAEAIAILGLVLVFLHQSPIWILPFAALSLVLQVLLSPLFANRGP